MFTGFQDRIGILSRGNLPPKQTLEGFYAGESVPVNQALSDVFIKLHITEHTGRGVPRITETYGIDVIRFNENSIAVTIPFNRLGQEVYGDGQTASSVEDEIPPVNMRIPPVIPPVNVENPPVTPPVEDSVENQILAFCMKAKGILEIAEHLGYKDKKTVRKYLNPLIEQGRIARTIPDKPNSRLQKYITIK